MREAPRRPLAGCPPGGAYAAAPAVASFFAEGRVPKPEVLAEGFCPNAAVSAIDVLFVPYPRLTTSKAEDILSQGADPRGRGNGMELRELAERQREFYRTGQTLDYAFRAQALDRLAEGLDRRQDRLLQALEADLGKPPFESYMAEIGLVKGELRWQRTRLRANMRPRRALTPLAQFKARSFRDPHPYGAVLIMAPWNYPLLLSLAPLAGALAAGNCAAVKLSDQAPHTGQALVDLLADCFEPGHVFALQGDRRENQVLLAQRFDKIFFTGSPAVGRVVLEAAAQSLTPAVLELGGKSPCIVAAEADLPLAARRIVFGKFLNGGQTCVAPDYLLADRSILPRLTELLRQEIERAFGPRPMEAPGYPRIVNQKRFDRLRELMGDGRIVCGGGLCPQRLTIEPTLLTEVSPESPLMQEEIFGPLLPLLPYDRLEEALSFVENRPHPLALYFFTEDKKQARRAMSRLQFGGGCVNDTVVHLASPRLPFGGVGQSGMGAYHGRQSFETFTHYRSIVDTSTKIDLPIRYRPYTPAKFWLLRRFLK